MKCLPTNSRRGASDVDLCPASPKRVPSGPQDPFGGLNSAVSDPSPCEYTKLWAWFAETEIQSHSNGPAMEPARVKWEMSVNSRS